MDINNLDIESENIQDVLDRNSHWILRYGIISIFLLIIAVLIGSYFIKYPEKGTFEISISKNFLNDSDIVNNSELIKYKEIAIEDTLYYIGKIRIPNIYSCNINKGQDVLIKLINYSNNEKSIIQSKISTVYFIPNYDYSIAEVYLPLKSLRSFYKEISYKKELKGTAILTTGEDRFLLKIFQPLKSIFKESN